MRAPTIRAGALSILLSAHLAFASVERSIVVAQPIVTEEAICLSDVTYITYSHGIWGDVVDYTCSENYIVVGDHEKPENRNAASLAGIKAVTDIFHHQEQALYGDTLRVVVDVSAIDSSKVDFDAEDIVDATIECVFINATRSVLGWDGKASAQVAAKHLRVDVIGPPKYSKLSATYSFKDLEMRKIERACYGTN